MEIALPRHSRSGRHPSPWDVCVWAVTPEVKGHTPRRQSVTTWGDRASAEGDEEVVEEEEEEEAIVMSSGSGAPGVDFVSALLRRSELTSFGGGGCTAFLQASVVLALVMLFAE